jgi:uncharacterized membrane protein YdbT with pleckstrin-like domain
LPPWSQETANVLPGEQQQEAGHTDSTVDDDTQQQQHAHEHDKDENNTIRNDDGDNNKDEINTSWEDEEMEGCSVAATESLTGASSSSSSLSTLRVVSATKPRIRRAYRSPKKWRRMIRTHRLQSIFLDC